MLALPHVGSGKVREIYRVDPGHLLFVATDRISAYDVILIPEIPDKGRVLTGMSEFFFGLLDLPNHFVTADLETVDGLDPADRAWLGGRAMVVRRAEMFPIECVVRGFLYGSAWREYAAGGGPSTEHLPAGLEMGSRLPEPIFTPATKAESGHDVNLDEAQARRLVGDDTYELLRTRSMHAYRLAAAHAERRGLLLADTKFEFGTVDGEVVLADEVLTPDSSRYWAIADHRPGIVMPSFDKQPVRDWLDSTGWDHVPPAPDLPDEVVMSTRRRYIEAFERITDTGFEQYLEDHGA